MTRETLAARLGDHPWAERLVVLDTVTSTNTVARDLAKQGAEHGTVVLADYQTGGKGRLGRRFSSPAGLGIYCSVVLRPAVEPERLLHLTPMAAEAVRRAVVEATGLQPEIKWINDLVLDGRKLCGILTELGMGADGKADFVIVGIGINCGQQTDDFPPELQQMAVSLSMALGRPVEREQIIAAVLRQLAQASDALLTDASDWMHSYRTHCLTIGKDVQLIRGDTVRYAHVDDMDDQGALLVTLADGTKEKVFSGEVSVRGMYGYI